jgi:hypothetical protein
MPPNNESSALLRLISVSFFDYEQADCFVKSNAIEAIRLIGQWREIPQAPGSNAVTASHAHVADGITPGAGLIVARRRAHLHQVSCARNKIRQNDAARGRKMARRQTQRFPKVIKHLAEVENRFLNQRKHFFTNFCLIGFRIFSLILLTDFHFCRQFSKSDLWLFLVLIWGLTYNVTVNPPFVYAGLMKSQEAVCEG